MVGKEICLLMKTRSRFIKLKRWLASTFTLDYLISKLFLFKLAKESDHYKGLQIEGTRSFVLQSFDTQIIFYKLRTGPALRFASKYASVC